MKVKSLLGAILLLSPALALAQSSAEPFGPIAVFFIDVMKFINDVLIPLVFTIALLSFLYGMFEYFIRGGASDTEQEKGKQLMIYAVAGFVLMVSIWGIVTLVASGLFGVSPQPPQLPGLPGMYSGGSSYQVPNFGAQ